MSETDWNAIHRAEAAAAKASQSADRMEDAVQRMAHMLEPGYGGNALRLIELLEGVEASPDGNVEAVRQKLLARSKVGLAKYGVTTERDDLDLVAWLRHLQEELLDAAVYVEAAIKRIEGDKNG